MTTKTLTGAYPTGYSLASGVTQLIVSQTANVGGTGVSAAYAATISNYGTIQASAYYGVNLRAGGSVINGSISDRTALISGSRYGVAARYGGASLTNNGTINVYGSFLDMGSFHCSNSSSVVLKGTGTISGTDTFANLEIQ